MLGTLSALFYQLATYAAQFKSLARRWSEERFDLLQLGTPGVHIILNFICAEQLKDVATKEVQLVGASCGSRSAAGGADFMTGGAVPANDVKEAEI